MSDDIELNTNNLCAAEDAFEQFQAVSMSREDEYITLSDIVPTNQDQSEDSGELSQIPYDNEVVLATTDAPQEVSSNSYFEETEPSTHHESNNASLTSTDSNLVGKSIANNETPQLPKTRGRKKKNPIENNTSLKLETETSSLVSSNNVAGDNITPIVRRGRGRPPRKSANVSNTSTELPESESISGSSLTSTNEVDYVAPFATGKRRGRPPLHRRGTTRSQVCDLIAPAADSTTSFDNLLSSEISGSENDEQFTKKRTLKRKKTSKTSSELVNKYKSYGNDNKMEVDYVEDTLSQKDSVAQQVDKNVAQKQKTVEKQYPNDKICSPKLTNNVNDDLEEISLSLLKRTSDLANLEHTEEQKTGEINFNGNNANGSSNKVSKRGGKKFRPKKVPAEMPSVPQQENKEEDDETDNLSLSKLKETIEPNTSNEESNITDNTKLDTPTKRNTKMPTMSDFEYNIDSIVGNENKDGMADIDTNQSLLTEDTSKRPIRRKIKQKHYDEDPFANEESSDDEPKSFRKGHRYDSDDEYYPESKIDKNITETSSDTEIDEGVDLLINQKKRRGRKKFETQSPRKRGKNDTNINNPDSHPEDIEEVLLSSVISASDDLKKHQQSWGSSNNEFENFLAKKIHGTDLKIKKVTTSKSSESNITPLAIPMIVPEQKKTVEMCCQTTAVSTASTSAQTSPIFDIPMKENLTLTKEQSEKACAFLNSIVQTTSELGQLMTQKSQDFIKKKIHTQHVIDTFKMDYCVRKSFLLFKLAKHNLMQMEEDLAKQYDEFLQSNNLSFCREKPKELVPNIKPDNDDSDCEIVEESGPTKQIPKSKSFNPKTVFLNKELSIKIAKKPSENTQGAQKNINIKGRHTVWINDTVMVKKVKPTQSFLAQDSRNKKPPDTFVTADMVSDFFKKYYRQRALAMCAPFTSIKWRDMKRECVCNYFVVKSLALDVDTNFSANDGYNVTNASGQDTTPVTNNMNDVKPVAKVFTSPESLYTLCTRILICKYNKSSKEETHNTSNNLTDGNKQPLMLFRLCLSALTDDLIHRPIEIKIKQSTTDYNTRKYVPSLKTLCYKQIVDLVFKFNRGIKPGKTNQVMESKNTIKEICLPGLNYSQNGIMSLFSMCVEVIQCATYYDDNINHSTQHSFTPNTLKHIALEHVNQLLYTSTNQCKSSENNLEKSLEDEVIGGLTINSINTLSEEAFLNLESVSNFPDNCEHDDDFHDNDSNTNDDSNFATCSDDYDGNNSQDSNWVSQVQMRELKSGSSAFNTVEDRKLNNISIVTQIKLEPLEDPFESVVGDAVIKTELAPGLDQITMMHDVNTIKLEDETAGSRILERQSSSSYDVDVFENFVRSSKLMRSLEDSNGDIFSQSALRVRRQHEPDIYSADDMNMDLLIPQTFEPVIIENAKGSLMESSSDESSKTKKSSVKKKSDKRKGKTKKSNTQNVPATITNKETDETNEVAVLTKKLRDKIRHEKRKDDSTDSENESIALVLKNKRDNNDKTKAIPTENIDNEIQCSNVDSTENITHNLKEKFTGFTAIDLNETSSYQKFVKYVYDKIVPSEDNNTQKIVSGGKDNSNAPAFDSNEPVELLECEPALPMIGHSEIKTHKQITAKKVNKNVQEDKIDGYVDRHGWKCYPVNIKDTKLYQNAEICLERLPESFVETYFHYQDITTKTKEDMEVDRLANLNTLNRSINAKEGKNRGKFIKKEGKSDRRLEQNSEIATRTSSHASSDPGDELEPSEDEGADPEDELPLLAPRQTENILAKSSLMNDKDSDSEGASTIKMEIESDPSRPNTRKSKPKINVENTEPLMLTADKMMNKELDLLHAPVVLNDDVHDETSNRRVTRSNQKNAHNNQSLKDNVKNDDHSSSEEEKQWVNTKEKLLKRMGKKEDASANDAKRAKIVNEFIERRGDDHDLHKRARCKRGRSRKKFLERQKQLKVLSRELFGESSTDPSHKTYTRSNFKGRRNIRKVLDKKSLARSTVKANMEEFERKRRLNAKQTRLRELLGCEEGVNVLVINDEVCLEYDFEEHRPIVTIHPFFTKVMKAHQYEGVKFMWDACFESLEMIEGGHPGGGCILAHCMGLGKTLQVLALLHTVLTHPRVGMRRVLVCCPLSTVLNWVDEIHKWIGPVTNAIKVFELSKLKKTYERAYQLEDWYNGGGIFIIGYELFRGLSTLDPFLDDIRPTIINKIRTALLDPGPDIIVCDEGHLLKNDCSVLAVAMSRVATKRRIVLTGTPMQNNLREYYCMVNFVKPNLLGTYLEYSNRFENPIMNGQHRDSQEEDIKLMKARTHILHKVLEGCLQRQEASVLYPYLPKKHEYTVFVPLTKCQWDMYKHYLTHYGKHAKHGILKDFHVLHKIWSHPQVLHNFQTKARDDKPKKEKLEDDLANEDHEDIKPNETEVWWLQYLDGGRMLESLESSNKFAVVFRILDECMAVGDKMLIFSTSLFCLDGLEYFLKKINKWRLGQEYFRLDGSVPAEVRQKWCREFNADNNEKTKVFLVSTRAGCLGLNMTAANRVIILDTSWNPSHDIQSIFRVYRFGQKKDCYIYRLVAMGTMEQKIYERSVTKQAVACRVIDEQQIDRHYNSADLTELYKYDESGASVAGGVAASVADVALLRVARRTALHAVHEHDSLLRGSEPALPEHERAAAWHQFQQEQQDKHVQIKLTINPQPVKKIPPKSIHGHDYAMAPISPQIKIEHTYRSRPGPKSKKLNRPTTSFVPSENESLQEQKVDSEATLSADEVPTKFESATHDYVGEIPSVQIIGSRAPTADVSSDDMVEKVTDILVKHDFQKEKVDIAALIRRVRQIVASGDSAGIQAGLVDDLARNIAQVILGESNGLAPTIAKTQEANANVARKTRKAAKTVNVKSQEVINLDDDDDSFNDRDTDDTVYVPPSKVDFVKQTMKETVKKPESSVTSKKVKKVSAVSAKPAKGESSNKNKTESVAKVAEPSSSILLSDEDEAVATEAVPDDLEPEKVLGLPPSLLTNKNFIKIVAHTYAMGNPMLDEDAATLAAQYSTFKALKESEQFGKPIVSGPIYDIAVKVLGVGVLKTLTTAKKIPDNAATSQFNDSTNAHGSVASSSGATKNHGVEPLVSEIPVTSIAEQKANVASPQLKWKPPILRPVKAIRIAPKPITPVERPTGTVMGNVVPVGLIKRGQAFPASQPFQPTHTQPPPPSENECILPDDDCIVPDEPAPTPKHTFVPKPPFVTHKTNTVVNLKANNRILNNLLNEPAKVPNFRKKPEQNLQTPSIQISCGRILNTDAEAAPTAATTPSLQDNQCINTICLDSDDDENEPLQVANRQAAKLIVTSDGPTRLVAAPNETNAPLMLQSETFSQPIVLQNKLPLGSSQRKFMLVPTTLLPSSLRQVIAESTLSTGQKLIKYSKPELVSGAKTVTSSEISSSASNMTKVAKSAGQSINISAPSLINTLSHYGKQSIIVGDNTCTTGEVFKVSNSGKISFLRMDSESSEVSNTVEKPSQSIHNPPVSVASPVMSQPSVPTTRPSTTRAGPSTTTPRPNTTSLRPSVTAVRPSATTSGPTATTSRPAATTLRPSTMTSRPTTTSRPITTTSGLTTMTSLPTTTSRPATTTSGPTAPKFRPIAPSTSKPSIRPRQVVEATSIGSTSSSNSSRSNSPDPLSILKDVVHIQAADEIPKETKKTTIGTNQENSRRPDTLSQHVDTIFKTKIFGSKPTCHKTLNTKNMKAVIDKFESSKQKSTSAGGKSSILRSYIGDTVKSSSKSSDKYSKSFKDVLATAVMKVKATKVSGNVKNIILDGVSKQISVNTKKNTSIDLTGHSSSSVTNKKRPAPAPSISQVPKKKRPPLTLKDFDLDDLDDIIELD